MTKSYLNIPESYINNYRINEKCKKCGEQLVCIPETRPEAYGSPKDELMLLCPHCDLNLY